jgi:uncharacterized membrane protein
MAKPDKETLEAWHNDPANWRMGVFYYNKKDKRIFPPKRLAIMGWTINFANPYSYLTFLLLVIFFVGFFFIFQK